MDNKKLRIYLAMFCALILVTQARTIATYISRLDYSDLIASKKPSGPDLPPDSIPPGGTGGQAVSPSPFFDPTAAPTPTLTPLPTRKPAPTALPRPTAVPTRIPTRAPPRTPTAVPTARLAPPAVSQSKLSEFMIGRYTEGAQKILEANPRLVKVIDPWTDGAFYEAIGAYKKRVPGAVAVVRFYEGTAGLYYTADTDPAASAKDFYDKAIGPGLSRLGGNKGLFDYLQTPNEYENTPMWKGEKDMKWNGSFWRKLTELTAAGGMKLCIGGIPVGNIEAPELGFIIDDLRAMKQKGAAFCYHGYTFNYSQDTGHEIWYSLRYRQYYDYFRANAADLADMPLILSEGGVAGEGDPYAGYQKYGGADKYEPWLKWFDGELRKDSYVRGVTLFQIGNGSDWGAFDLEPISDWLSDYIRSQR